MRHRGTVPCVRAQGDMVMLVTALMETDLARALKKDASMSGGRRIAWEPLRRGGRALPRMGLARRIALDVARGLAFLHGRKVRPRNGEAACVLGAWSAGTSAGCVHSWLVMLLQSITLKLYGLPDKRTWVLRGGLASGDSWTCMCCHPAWPCKPTHTLHLSWWRFQEWGSGIKSKSVRRLCTET